METRYPFEKQKISNGIIISQLPQQIQTFNDLVIFMESNKIATKQIINHVFNNNNGTALCYFETFEQAKVAMNSICGKYIQNTKISASIIMDKSLLTLYNNQNIYIQYLKNGVDEQKIIDYIESIYHKTILSIKIKSDDTTLSRSAFVNLKTQEEAQSFNGVTILALSKRPLKVLVNKYQNPMDSTEDSGKSKQKIGSKPWKPIEVNKVKNITSQSELRFPQNNVVIGVPKDFPDLRRNQTLKIIYNKSKINNLFH